MAWEKGYYYRKQWRNGKVRSVYVGAGLPGARAAQEDAQAQRQRVEQRTERARQRAEVVLVDEEYRRLRDLVSAYLLTTGYHRHKRQWRRIRG